MSEGGSSGSGSGPSSTKRRKLLGENLDPSFLSKLSQLQNIFCHDKIQEEEQSQSTTEETLEETLLKLLKYGTDVNVNFLLNRPPLLHFLKRGSPSPQNSPPRRDSILRLLTEIGGGQGQGHSVTSGGGQNEPLHLQVLRRMEEEGEGFRELALDCLMRLLTLDGGDVNCPYSNKDIWMVDEVKRKFALLQILLRFGSDVNLLHHHHHVTLTGSGRESDGFSDNDGILRTLLSEGSDCNLMCGSGSSGCNPLHNQIMMNPHSHFLITELLITNGDTVNCVLNGNFMPIIISSC